MAASVKIRIYTQESVKFRAPLVAKAAREGRMALTCWRPRPAWPKAAEQKKAERARMLMKSLIEEVERYLTRNEPLSLEPGDLEKTRLYMEDIEPKRAFIAEAMGIPPSRGYFRGDLNHASEELRKLLIPHNARCLKSNEAALLVSLRNMRDLLEKPFEKCESSEVARISDFLLRVETLADNKRPARERELYAS